MAADLDWRAQGVWSALVAYLGWLFPVLNLVVIVGALRMRALRDLGLARAGAVCAMAAPPFMPVGLLVGARALWLLRDPKLRAQFHPCTSPAVPAVSRLAVASASLAMAHVAANYSLAFLNGPARGPDVWHSAGQILLQILSFLSYWPGFAASCLGAVALEDVRRGHGRLQGAWLAAFGLLVAPCLWLVFEALRNMNLAVSHGLETTAVFLICGGLALWVRRHETRRRQSGGSDSTGRCWWVSNPGLRALQALALIPFLLAFFNSLVLVAILRGLFK